ncbi:MAG TPA: energy-coupling factor transporter transmembrane protein EcfT [Ruminococcaceae bacterium]|jgi:energy-coupling factor transport system permease protein|nr:energy-coupling factor transporter transmembrane protein EcfT [Oscillospiraceae bacterium]
MSKGHGIRFDPRTKLLLLLLCALCAATAPILVYEFGLVGMIALLGFFSGRRRYPLIGLAVYAVIFALTKAALSGSGTTFQTTLIAFLGLVHKVYPCGFLAGILISTTRVSEFLCAMHKIHAPKSLTIPMAVMLRYLPTIREDWGFIKDAMRLRDVSPSLKGLVAHPGMTVECLYVPLMMSASRAADELSIASVTRGIENPAPRTCLIQIRLGLADLLAAFCFAAYFIAGRFG